MVNEAWKLATIQHYCKFAAYFIHLYPENYYFFIPHSWQGRNTPNFQQNKQANKKEKIQTNYLINECEKLSNSWYMKHWNNESHLEVSNIMKKGTVSLTYLRNSIFVWPKKQSDISTPWKKKQRTSNKFLSKICKQRENWIINCDVRIYTKIKSWKILGWIMKKLDNQLQAEISVSGSRHRCICITRKTLAEQILECMCKGTTLLNLLI